MLNKLLIRLHGSKGREQKQMDPRLNNNCSEFEVNHWVIDDFILRKIIPITGVRPFPLCELSLLVRTVVGLKPTQIFEWGTNVGKSARIFYESCLEFNIQTAIHSIDLPDDIYHNEHPNKQRGILVRDLREVALHQGDGVTVALNIYKNDSSLKPLFFLDGDHSYESILRELNLILENVPSPIILIHDTFYQSSDSGYNIGPYKAICSIMTKNADKFKQVSTANGLPGLTLLY